VVTRGWEEEVSNCLIDTVSVWEDEKVLEMDGAEGCTTM